MRAAHGAAPLRGRGGTRHRWLAAAAVGAVLVMSACSDNGSGPDETPTLSLALSASTVSVVQGQSATVTATITRGGGFSAAVALTVEGAPAGLTAAFAPASLSGTTTSSTLTLTAATGLAAGTYNLTVRAAGTGVTAQTSALAVTVSAAPAIALAANPAALTLVQGTSGTSAITLTRIGGFAGAVDLTLAGAPAGVITSFTVELLGAGVTTSTLNLNVGASVAAGVYQLTIRGHGTGVTDQTVTLPLTVVAATPQGFTLALAPATLSVQQGASGTVKLTATRAGGFAGPITVSAGGAPAGVTPTLPSPTLAGDTMTLTFAVAGLGSAGGTPLPGVYVITVSGQATGLSTQSVQLPLTVTASPGGFDVTVSPAAVSVQAGGTGRTAVRIARSGGYAGSVTLSVTGAPAGLTATLAAATTLADSVELSLAAGAAVAPAAYPLKVIGQVAGLPSDTTTLTVTVTAAPASNFTVALNPTAVTVQQGTNATSAVSITRTNFTGAVTLSVSGAPNGVTVTLDSTTVGGNGTTVRVAVAIDAAPGTYNLTVHGTATGIAEKTAALAVTVTPRSTGGNATMHFCADDIPVFLAVQNGNGPWTRVTGVNGDFTFTVDQRGAVAYVDDNSELNVIFAAGDELRGMGGNRCIGDDVPVGKTMTGTVAGLGLSDQASITLGTAGAVALGLLPNYQLTHVPDGALDLIAARMQFDLQSGTLTADKFILRRGLDLPNNAVIPVLDFGSAEAFAPVQSTLTVNGLGTDTASLGLGYITGATAATSGFGTGAFYFFGRQQTTGTYPGIPAAKQVSGDLHLLSIFATTGATSTRGQISYFTLAANRTVTLSPPLGAPTITTVASSPYLQLRLQLAKQAEYDDALTATFTQTGHSAVLTATPAYFAAGFTTWDVAIPDLSAIGFLPAWGLAAVATDWTLSGASYTGITPSLNVVPTDGAILQFATRTGAHTP